MKGQLAPHSALIAGIVLTVCLAVTEAPKIPLCSFSYMAGEDAVITFPVPSDPQKSFKIWKTLTSGENESIIYCHGHDDCRSYTGYNISFNETTKLISVVIINVCFAHKGDYTLIFKGNLATDVCSLDVTPNMVFKVTPVIKNDGTLDYINLSCDGDKSMTPFYLGKAVPEFSCTCKDTCNRTVTQKVSHEQILLQLVMTLFPLPRENGASLIKEILLEYKQDQREIWWCVIATFVLNLLVFLLLALPKVRDVPHLFSFCKSSKMPNTAGEPSTPKGPNTPAKPNISQEHVQLLATDPDPGVSYDLETNFRLRRYNNITPVSEDAASDTPVN